MKQHDFIWLPLQSLVPTKTKANLITHTKYQIEDHIIYPKKKGIFLTCVSRVFINTSNIYITYNIYIYTRPNNYYPLLHLYTFSI